MRLEIGAFHVKDIKFGDKTGYSNGILTVNKEELLKVVKEDEHITTADLRIVHPGDEVVLCPVMPVSAVYGLATGALSL